MPGCQLSYGIRLTRGQKATWHHSVHDLFDLMSYNPNCPLAHTHKLSHNQFGVRGPCLTIILLTQNVSSTKFHMQLET